jgi:nucleoside-diphosphate-sugar epimerase
MSHILVTGGAGYLGSTLVPALLDAGHEVTVLDNFMFRQASLNHVCHHPKFHIVKGDIRLESTMAPLLAKADIVIPLAAMVGAPMCQADPVGAHSINHDAIMLMLRLMSRSQRILMPTTNSAYGSGDSNHHCTETSPLRPISLYAKEKVAVELELMQRQEAISFRLATVFGMSPRMRIDLLVNDFVYRAVHDRFVVLFESDFKRNYIHVRDVARVFLHGIDHFDQMRGEVYNVGCLTPMFPSGSCVFAFSSNCLSSYSLKRLWGGTPINETISSQTTKSSGQDFLRQSLSMRGSPNSSRASG